MQWGGFVMKKMRDSIMKRWRGCCMAGKGDSYKARGVCGKPRWLYKGTGG